MTTPNDEEIKCLSSIESDVLTYDGSSIAATTAATRTMVASSSASIAKTMVKDDGVKKKRKKKKTKTDDPANKKNLNKSSSGGNEKSAPKRTKSLSSSSSTKKKTSASSSRKSSSKKNNNNSDDNKTKALLSGKAYQTQDIKAEYRAGDVVEKKLIETLDPVKEKNKANKKKRSKSKEGMDGGSKRRGKKRSSNNINNNTTEQGNTAAATNENDNESHDLATDLPSIWSPATIHPARASEPGAQRVIPAVGIRQDDESETSWNDEEDSPLANIEMEHDDDHDNSNPLIQAELVDLEAQRRQVLQDAVQVEAELLDDKEKEDGRPKWLQGRNLWIVVGCGSLILLVVIIIAVVVSSGGGGGGDDSNNNNDNGGGGGGGGNNNGSAAPTDAPQTPTVAPTPIPTLPPTRVPTTQAPTLVPTSWEILNLEPLDGLVSDPFVGAATGPLDATTSYFGTQVAMGAISQQNSNVFDSVNNGNATKRHLVAVAYGNSQFLYAGPELGAMAEHKKLAMYLCDSETGCQPSLYFDGAMTQGSWDDFAMSDDGKHIAIAAGGYLLVHDLELWEPPAQAWENAIVTEFPPYVYESPGTKLVALNPKGNVLAAVGSLGVRVFNFWDQFAVPSNTEFSEFSSGPTMNFDLNSFTVDWAPDSESNEKVVAVACNDNFVVVGTNVQNPESADPYFDGFKVRVFLTNILLGRTGGEGEVGQLIEQGSDWTLLSNYSLAISDGDQTMLAIGSSYQDPGIFFNATNRQDFGEVNVYRYVGCNPSCRGEWIQVGSTLRESQPGGMFGASVALNSAGTILAVGAPADSANGPESGYVFTYRLDGNDWVPLQQIPGRSPQRFGETVALSHSGSGAEDQQSTPHEIGTTLVVGAPNSDLRGRLSGEAFVYNLIQGPGEAT